MASKTAAVDESNESSEVPASFVKAPPAASATKKLTWAALSKKPRRTRTFDFYLGGEKYEGKVAAISQREYDDLLAQCPPTDVQKEAGVSFDEVKHAPLLIAACFTQPVLTVEQATALFDSSDWNRGEVAELYRECLAVNHTGVSTPF